MQAEEEAEEEEEVEQERLARGSHDGQHAPPHWRHGWVADAYPENERRPGPPPRGPSAPASAYPHAPPSQQPARGAVVREQIYEIPFESPATFGGSLPRGTMACLAGLDATDAARLPPSRPSAGRTPRSASRAGQRNGAPRGGGGPAVRSRHGSPYAASWDYPPSTPRGNGSAAPSQTL